MLKRPFRSGLLLTVACTLVACGSAPPAKAPAPENSAQPAPAATVAPAPQPVAAPEPTPPQPQESPGFAQSLASLRPVGTEPVLQALTGAPADPEAYAKAALAYALTDVPGMTLLWGISYQAMGGGASDAAVANALSKVLTERILAKPDAQQQVTFNLRLAPGSMPTRVEPDGATLAPIAHTFESLFSPAVTGFRPPWTIEQFYDALSSWAGIVATRGTPLDEKLPVNAWLALAAKQGHLEAFCYQLLGPAFPAELKAFKAGNAAALKAYLEFLKTSPLRPQHAPLPDELVRIK
ncbi:MAG TPA: hypothetical protein VHP33_27080 [Polyangiaceae bacterium]|nr:hypothetical protein [Polyangiaceae bacterium]